MPQSPALAVQRHDPASAPAFVFDFSSPDAYLAAERVASTLGGLVRWIPVHLAELPGAADPGAFRCASEREIFMGDVERRALAQGLQPIRWPQGWPADPEPALRAATYAAQIGRGVAFSLAAFRQAFAAGRDLSEPDNVLIAASACEMHPTAVLKALGTRGVASALAEATARAAAVGVREVPSIVVGERVFTGEAGIDEAAGALREAQTA
jgi:2-hydroxychromene-2-carboxylate isomerase